MENKKPVLFAFSGTVQKHLRRGTKLGYPTANIKIDMDTPEGIFVGYANVDSTRRPSLIFVGKSLTFDEHNKKAEIFILDFDEDIYDKHIKVEVYTKLRDNQKFDSSDELKLQIEKDVVQARGIFSTMNK